MGLEKGLIVMLTGRWSIVSLIVHKCEVVLRKRMCRLFFMYAFNSGLVWVCNSDVDDGASDETGLSRVTAHTNVSLMSQYHHMRIDMYDSDTLQVIQLIMVSFPKYEATLIKWRCLATLSAYMHPTYERVCSLTKSKIEFIERYSQTKSIIQGCQD